MPIRKARSGSSRHSGVQDTEKQTSPNVKDGAFYPDASGNPKFKSPEAGEVDLAGGNGGVDIQTVWAFNG